MCSQVERELSASKRLRAPAKNRERKNNREKKIKKNVLTAVERDPAPRNACEPLQKVAALAHVIRVVPF